MYIEDLVEDLKKSDDEFAKRMSAWLEDLLNDAYENYGDENE